MRQIPITALTPGMVTATDILSCDRRTIVPKGIILTENIIARLEGYSIFYAQIEENLIIDLSQENSIPALCSADAKSGNENNQLQQFSQNFAHCAEHFQNTLISSLYRNEPFCANELLAETLALLPQSRQQICIFDMLINMPTTDDSIYRHCIAVALISNVLARWLGFSKADQAMATACGLFHDIGKMMLSTRFSQKSGKPTPDEFEIIKTHTTEGFHLLGRYHNIPDPVKNTALMHHEKCDGSGYPYGLTGDEIDKFSKIVSIANIFDTMSNEHRYHLTICPFSIIKFFENDGIQKYETNYILTFLENLSNTYLSHKITLSSGMEGNVIFITLNNMAKPINYTENSEDNACLDLEIKYYNSILLLANLKNISIETIII